MKIQINGKEEEIDREKVSVSELLVIKDIEMPDMVSIELNGTILDKDQYGGTVVKSGDVLEFLYFMGGGSASGI